MDFIKAFYKKIQEKKYQLGGERISFATRKTVYSGKRY